MEHQQQHGLDLGSSPVAGPVRRGSAVGVATDVVVAAGCGCVGYGRGRKRDTMDPLGFHFQHRAYMYHGTSTAQGY